jgi:hypothetical protein
MSDENTVMPDSDSLSPVSETADSQEVAQATVEGTEPTVVKASPKGSQVQSADDSVMAKRLSDTETALKERQRDFTEMSLKLAELKGQMSQMNLQAQQDDAIDPLTEVYDEKLKEQFASDPQGTMAEILARQQRQFAKLLQQRDEYMETKMKERFDEQLNPERLELRDTIISLSKHPWFSRLSPSEQVEAAKEYKGTSKTNVEPPATAMGGTGRRVAQTGKTNDQLRAEKAQLDMQSSFPDNSQDNKLMPSLSVDSRIRR